MARATTTSDVFNAIAEPQRRRILTLLRAGERPATEIATSIDLGPSPTSKHLRVLREVGLVRVREEGRQRHYALDARGLQEVHEWTGGFERFWSESFDRLEAYADELQQKEAAMQKEEQLEPEAARELVTTREINGPRELVFRAWTAAHHLAQWFGPRGFTTETRSFEFRPGGVWEFDMIGPDGTIFPNWIEWREITPPEQISYRQGSRPDDPDEFQTTVTFVDRGGRTEITLRALFRSQAQRDYVARHFRAAEGGRETLQRLEDYVQTLMTDPT